MSSIASPSSTPPLTLNAARRGVGPCLVFLHYFGGSSHTWGEVIDYLQEGFDCIALDLRGWGDSPAPDEGYSVADTGRDVENTLQTLGVGEYVLVGHSMGGKVAQWMAAQSAPGLTRLLLAAPSPLSPEPMSDTSRRDLREAWGDRDACRAILANITAQALPPIAAQGVLADNLRASRAAWHAWCDLGSRENLAGDYAHINIPTALLAGECDAPLSPAFLHEHVAARLTHCPVSVVSGAGHLLPLEAPEAVAGFIRRNVREG